MIAHHTLGFAGATGRIYQTSQIQIDIDRRRSLGREFPLNGREISITNDTVPQRGAIIENDGSGATIVEDVLEFVEFDTWIDQDERRAGFQYGENADDGCPIVRETHANAVAALHAVLSKRVREAIRRIFDLGVRVAARAADERDLARASGDAVMQKILY